jgi:mono/diheme cytochrome c family protein
MKLRHILLLALGTLLLAACNMTLAADVTPPPGYVPPTPVPTLGPLYPDQAPDVENGKAIYAEKCAACHGETGLGDGAQSKDLPVSVIPIGLPEFSNEASPSDWYAVVTQGRLERFMPPFASLNDQERWDVVAYALTLHTTNEQIELGKSLFEANCADCGEAFSNLQMMSALSEDDLVKFVREGNGNFPAFGSGFSDEEAYAVAAYIRTLTFAVPSAPVAVAATETLAATEAVTTPAEGTPSAEATLTDGTPQAEVTEEPLSGSLIIGQIDNRTGEDLPSGLKVTLRGFDHGADPSAGPTEILNIQGDVNPDGSYAFEAELIESQIYLSEVEINGMSYQSAFAVVPAGASELVLEPIVVYPTSEDISQLQVEELQIYFDFASEETQIFAVYFITNTSEQTVLVPMAEGTNIPFISFPEGATGLGFETTDNSAKFVQTENGFAIPPSETPYGLIAFASIPKASELKIVQPALLPINSISLFLPEGMNAEGTTLTDTGIQNLQGANFHVYTAAPVAQDTNFEFTLTGEPASVSESPDITQNQTVLIGVGVLGVILILAGVFIYMRDRKKFAELDEEDDDEVEDDDDRFEDSESIMDAIIALDDLHRAGKIGDEAYKKRRAELTSALKKG